MFEFLAGFDLTQLGIVAIVTVAGAYLGAAVAVAWLKRLLVRLAFRHVAFAGASAVGGAALDRVTAGGVSGAVEFVLDVLLGGIL